ncbi:MAG: hypothetical protein KDD63_09600 [Bacteroidetes bacterium]|nr:hypothetical protein [Bacteroidota bacterium]
MQTYWIKSFLFLLFLLFLFPILKGQPEYQTHLNSIRNSSFKEKTENGWIGDSAFIEFVISEVLDGPEDIIFISNRDLLTPLCIKHCASSQVSIYDTLEDGRIIDFHIEAENFDPESHEFSYFEGEDSLIETIDGFPAYGGTFSTPKVGIKSMTAKIGKKKIKVPPEAYADLYNPNFCNNELFSQSVMAYPSLSGEYFYLYIYGGSGSDTYFAKLIFDKKDYIKKIVVEYADLIAFGSLRWGFIGY